MIETLILLSLSYLLGSIPSSVWIGKAFYGKDVREHGSGNAGTTNTFRVLGKKAGIPVFLIDAGKGALAASLPYLSHWLFPQMDHVIDYLPLQDQSLICGILSVVGHIYPLFAGFQGGKGIATLLGMMLVANPLAALVSLGVWLLVLLISKYVSLSALVAVFVFPLFIEAKALLLGEPFNWPMLGLGLGLFLLVCWTHRTNIRRIADGNENKTFLFKGRGT